MVRCLWGWVQILLSRSIVSCPSCGWSTKITATLKIWENIEGGKFCFLYDRWLWILFDSKSIWRRIGTTLSLIGRIRWALTIMINCMLISPHSVRRYITIWKQKTFCCYCWRILKSLILLWSQPRSSIFCLGSWLVILKMVIFLWQSL